MFEAITIDRRCCCGCRFGSTKTDPNENYAREMQSCSRSRRQRLHRAGRARARPRAVGMDEQLDQATGEPDDFHFDATLHDDGVR